MATSTCSRHSFVALTYSPSRVFLSTTKPRRTIQTSSKVCEHPSLAARTRAPSLAWTRNRPWHLCHKSQCELCIPCQGLHYINAPLSCFHVFFFPFSRGRDHTIVLGNHLETSPSSLLLLQRLTNMGLTPWGVYSVQIDLDGPARKNVFWFFLSLLFIQLRVFGSLGRGTNEMTNTMDRKTTTRKIFACSRYPDPIWHSKIRRTRTITLEGHRCHGHFYFFLSWFQKSTSREHCSLVMKKRAGNGKLHLWGVSSHENFNSLLLCLHFSFSLLFSSNKYFTMVIEAESFMGTE